MKRLLFMLTILASALTINAQPEAGTFSVIPRVGVSITNVSSNILKFDFSEDIRNSQFKPGYMAGVDLQYQIMKNIAASAGAFYALQGCKYKDIGNIKEEQGSTSFSGASDCHVNLGYVNVPLMIHWYVYQGLALQTGLQMGFLVNAKSHHTDTEYTETKDESGKIERTYLKDADGNLLKDHLYTSNIKDQLRSTDFSVPVGLSYEYMNVVLDARYNIGLRKIYKSGGHHRNEVFLFSAGYKFNL